MNIIFLDAKTIGDDIDLSKFNQLGTVTLYDFTSPDQMLDRVQNADVIIVNKAKVNESTIHSAKNLKLVCVTATGTDNLDKEYLDTHNIQWRNVAGYSTDSVVQHTFAMLFYLVEKLRYYDDYVKDEHYINDKIFTHFAENFYEIKGKTWGIIGLGNIGRKVADIAKAFGAKIIYYSPSGSPSQAGYNQVDFQTLLSTSDIVSIHAPLTEKTKNLLDIQAFRSMKSSAILLNLGRGPIIVEQDLVLALNSHEISAAGLDVLSVEPMEKENPLCSIKDSKRLFITPHIAWASIEARTRLMDIIWNQVNDFSNTK